MLLFVWLILVFLLIFTFKFGSRRMRLNNYVKMLPTIPIKMLLPILQPNKTSAELFQCVENVINYNDGLSSCWLGPILVVMCDDPENMKTILMSKNCIDRPYIPYGFLSALGNGLFTSNGHYWRMDRKGINTVFTLSILKKFQPILNRRFANFAKNLEKYVDQPEFDFEHHIYECTFDVLLANIFRCDSLSEKRDKMKMIECVGRMWKIVTVRAANMHLHPSFIYRLTNLYAEEKKIDDFMSQHLSKLLKNCNENYVSNSQGRIDRDDCKDTNSMIFIDKLMEMKEMNLIDGNRILDQTKTFAITGTETSALTVLNTLLLLANHPNAQSRLYEEIRATVTDCDSIDYDTLSKLEYMERVLKESMRLLPLAHFLGRETDADVQLTDCTVPKGTYLLLRVVKMHRDANIWGPTANEFDPDRFLPELMAQRHPFAFLPFSAGPRNCIGYKYAMISMKVLLCHLLLRYKFTTSIRMSDIAFKLEFLLRPVDKYMFTLEKRCDNSRTSV